MQLPKLLLRWGLYPMSWLILGTGFYFLSEAQADPMTVYSTCGGLLFSIYLVIEWQVPYQHRWKMNWVS